MAPGSSGLPGGGPGLRQVVDDLSLGRNIDDVLRTLDALQRTEKSGDVCPANREQGKKAMEATSIGVEKYLKDFGVELRPSAKLALLVEYVLQRQAFVRAPLDDVFDFFSNARNLEKITPDWLHFRVLDNDPIEMKVGARIRYRLRVAGVPVHWDTCITRWEPGKSFVDRQEHGPYRLWDHTHIFEPIGDGVLMSDTVRYALPFGPLGRLAHALWVRSALARIFDYRFERISRIFEAR